MASAQSSRDEIAQLKRLLASRDELIAKLMSEIARLKRWRFGRSAERMADTLAQLQLALEDLQAAQSAEAATAPRVDDLIDAAPKQRVVALRRAPRCLEV